MSVRVEMRVGQAPPSRLSFSFVFPLFSYILAGVWGEGERGQIGRASCRERVLNSLRTTSASGVGQG